MRRLGAAGGRGRGEEAEGAREGRIALHDDDFNCKIEMITSGFYDYKRNGGREAAEAPGGAEGARGPNRIPQATTAVVKITLYDKITVCNHNPSSRLAENGHNRLQNHIFFIIKLHLTTTIRVLALRSDGRRPKMRRTRRARMTRTTPVGSSVTTSESSDMPTCAHAPSLSPHSRRAQGAHSRIRRDRSRDGARCLNSYVRDSFLVPLVGVACGCACASPRRRRARTRGRGGRGGASGRRRRQPAPG